MNEEVFYQNSYDTLYPILAKEGCYILLLIYISQCKPQRPLKVLRTQKEVIDYVNHCISKGWLKEDMFVQNAPAILKDLTGINFTVSSNDKVSLLGIPHALPANYPTPYKNISFGVLRKTDNLNITHFVLLDHENKIAFNTLTTGWDVWTNTDWFLYDKRVFYYA